MPENLPDEAEIARLPRWARVAFAARCARRMLPLMNGGWAGDTRRLLRASLDEVVGVTERAAAAAAIEAGVEMSAVADVYAGYSHAHTAYYAARAADYAARAADNADHTAADGTVRYATGAAAKAHAYANLAAADHAAEIVRCITRDFQTLCAAADAGAWTDSTPVPPAVFGPLWPEGVPPGWPSDSSEGGL